MADEIEAVADGDIQDYALDEKLVPSVLLAIAAGDSARLGEITADLHEADIADLLEQLAPDRRREFLLLAPQLVDGEVLSELDDGLREEVIAFLPKDALGEALRELESDDVVDLIEDLEEADQEILLDALEDADRVAVEQALWMAPADRRVGVIDIGAVAVASDVPS